MWDDERVITYDMLTQAKKMMSEIQAESSVSLRTFQEERWQSTMMFTCDDCENILTKENIEKIYEAEQEFIADDDYGSFCKAVDITDDSCDDVNGYLSLTKYFGTKLADDTLTQADVDKFINDLKTDDDAWTTWKSFIGNDFDRDDVNAKSIYARSFMDYRMPIEYDGKSYDSPLDESQKQDLHMIDWFEPIREDLEDTNNDKFWKGAFNAVIIDFTFLDVFNHDFKNPHLAISVGRKFDGDALIHVQPNRELKVREGD